MNLIDFILQADPKDFENKSFMAGQSLKNSEKQLFECDEFKNVIRINFIDLPAYLVDDESGEPIAHNREFLGGQTSRKQVVTYKFRPGETAIFNKVVDLYSLQIIKLFNTNEAVSKPGVWIYPTVFNDKFEPLKEVRVLWSPEQLQDAISLINNSNETAKSRLMRMFEQALDSMEPNLPCSYALVIRCSERSMANQIAEKTDSNEFTIDNQIQ